MRFSLTSKQPKTLNYPLRVNNCEGNCYVDKKAAIIHDFLDKKSTENWELIELHHYFYSIVADALIL